ncbi:type II toxin-antitoxin system PemK/MazF family toxin [bacterium]|nr:type II toxin-antitoxin system PemK/MazF family toxin [bacterium]
MEKDFQRWHKQKAAIDKKVKTIFFHERQIWWCALGTNVGNEQDGEGNFFARPVIVLRKFSKTTFWALPLTSKKKLGSYYYVLSSPVGGKKVTAVLHQLRLVDARRLSDMLGYVQKQDFERIKKSVSDFLH